jgi:hypothetical protein
MYSESVEEQRYLSSIRREKESFEKLIRENSVSEKNTWLRARWSIQQNPILSGFYIVDQSIDHPIRRW